MKADLFKNPVVTIFLIFGISIAAKALISLKFQGPYIFLDEMIYTKLAENLFSSEYASSPRMYSFILSIAYIFTRDQTIAYHIMLLINCIITSAAIFPSYFVLSKYSDKIYALIGSAAVIALPSMMLYNFAVMTENLFIPLFLFSIWFSLEAFETKKPLWTSLAIISAASIFFTRHTGIFMVLGLIVSFIYYEINEKIARDRTFRLNKNEIAISIVSLLVLIVAAYALLSVKSNQSHFLQWEIYSFNKYTTALAGIILNASSLTSFLSLLVHEIEYLIMSTYFVIFFIVAAFVSAIFHKSRADKRSSGKTLGFDWFDLSGIKGNQAFKSYIIYLLFSGFGLILAVVASMYFTVSNLSGAYDYYNMCYRVDFELLGRYIDPLVPAIFLLGLIGLDRMKVAQEKSKPKILSILIAAFILLSMVFALSFPYYANKIPDILTINYTKYLATIVPVWAIAPLISSIFVLGIYLCINDRKFRYLFLISVILVSITTSAYTIEETTLPASEFFTSHNSIGVYLENHSNSRTRVLMDKEDNQRDRIMMPLTRFWTHAKFVTRSTPEDPSGVYTDYARNVSYIISSKILPYSFKRLAYSTRGYILYKPTKIKDKRTLYGFDRTSGWNNVELWNGTPTSWMKSNASLTVYSGRNMAATLSFNVLSFYTKRELQVSYQDNLITLENLPASFVKVNVPIDLKRGLNKVYLYTPQGCVRPIDIPELGIQDSRCVSIAVQNLSISKRKKNASIPLVS